MCDVSRWLAGGGGLGGGAAPAPPLAPWGASSIRVAKKNARCPGLAGMAELRPLFPGVAGRAKPLICHNSQALSNVQEEAHICARDQVVIARPPAPTPPRRYRRSLVSKGRFAVSTNVICVGIRSSPPKRRYRVVVDNVGGPFSHRGRKGCQLFRGS
jgi:hypothetical protein